MLFVCFMEVNAKDLVFDHDHFCSNLSSSDSLKRYMKLRQQDLQELPSVWPRMFLAVEKHHSLHFDQPAVVFEPKSP